MITKQIISFFSANIFILYTTKLNILIFKTFLKILNIKNIYLIFNKSNKKYYWSKNFYSKEDILINFITLKNKKFLNFNKKLILNKHLNEIIYLKKKTSLIKKKNDINFIYLNKIYNDKIIFNNIFDNKKISKDGYINSNQLKTLDLKNKTKLLFKENRILLKHFFNIKHYRSFSLSKNIKKLSNFTKKNYILNLENSLINILINTDFFISRNDFLWFLDNGLITVNSYIIKKKFLMVKDYDIINIVNTKCYYFYYKNNFNQMLSNLYKINLKYWAINKMKSRNLDSKTINLNYPKWIENYKYFKKDLPKFLEVDYISMTIIILSSNKNFYNFNFYNFKFLNLYLNRLYNWKFII